MNMEIRNLQTFLKVAALGNFTHAGEALGYSQANISAQIKQLESEVGVPLFNRIGRGVTLTQFGETLLPYASRIVSTAEEMQTLLRPDAELTGTLRVGMVESLFDCVHAGVLSDYHRRFPRVKIALTVDATQTLKEKLQKGTIDLACLIDAPSAEAEWNRLYSAQTEVVVAANPSHPLAGRRSVTLSDLKGQQWVLMEESAPYSVEFHAALDRAEVGIEPFLTMQSARAACEMVQREPVLSLLPIYTIRSAVSDGRIVVLPLRELHLQQTVQILLHRGKAPVPQILGFAEETQRALSRLV